eukprot:749798-Hanusia_phi.AAC.1
MVDQSSSSADDGEPDLSSHAGYRRHSVYGPLAGSSKVTTGQLYQDLGFRHHRYPGPGSVQLVVLPVSLSRKSPQCNRLNTGVTVGAGGVLPKEEGFTVAIPEIDASEVLRPSIGVSLRQRCSRYRLRGGGHYGCKSRWGG